MSDMTIERIEEKLRQIVSAQLEIPIETINKESKFHGNLGLDSLDVVNLLGTINVAFGTKLFERDVAEIETIEDMAKCIASRIKQPAK